ncbi:MAG: pyridoxal phosphate-dependent aminotransferase [Salinarimonas sp.]|nr:pyridoxal phosphate-dependent aminotransferase [Salinarimonas sp.]
MTATFSIRPEAAQAPESGIVTLVDYGRGREGLIPLWVGEGDLATPAFIADAATRSLAAGETFYTYQRGLPQLREAISAYMERFYGRGGPIERYTVTTGGMHAIQIAARLVAGPGDEVIIPSPAWPNGPAAIGIIGAKPVAVDLHLDENGWQLDLARLAEAVTPRTRALLINTPANPTGWTASLDELRAIRDLAREHDLWIIADEIYGRFLHGETRGVNGRAPSFHDIAGDDEKILYVQTMSKNWAMTGWRIGWLEAPAALAQTIENLVQYSTSGVPVFIQRAAIAALDQGEGFFAHQVDRARRGRAIVHDALATVPGLVAPPPVGAFYAYFRAPGRDGEALAMRLVDEANVGLAPGGAFGSSGTDCLRLCFARRPEDLHTAMERLVPVLRKALADPG